VSLESIGARNLRTFASTPQSSSQHHSIADGDVVDRHQMSIDAGRAVLIVTRSISTAPTSHAKAAVVGIFLIDVRHFQALWQGAKSNQKVEFGGTVSVRIFVKGYSRGRTTPDDRASARSASPCDW
jgi:hypothetical protein